MALPSVSLIERSAPAGKRRVEYSEETGESGRGRREPMSPNPTLIATRYFSFVLSAGQGAGAEMVTSGPLLVTPLTVITSG